jgi:adenine phosphoribosyltransferase
VAAADRVLVVDDLLATGGTAAAVIELIDKLGGKIGGVQFLIELVDLKGRDALPGYDVRSVIKFEGD